MSPSDETLLDQRILIPDHVVHRTFVAETVVLNLQTGKYHGLNTMAGTMLETLGEGRTVGEAADLIAGEFGAEPAMVRDDLVAFCQDLLERGLVELDDGAGSSSAAVSGPSQGS